MTLRRSFAATVLLLGTSVLVAGCSTVQDALSGDDVSIREAQVVVLAPGADGAAHAGVEASVQLAQQQWEDIPGWRIHVVPAGEVPADDTGDDMGDDDDPVSRQERIRETATAIADGDTVAVIGGLDDAVIRSAAPVFDEESVIFVSPADTEPAHVRGTDPDNPMRPFDTYFRTPASTGIAGPAGRYLLEHESAQQVVIADDGGDQVVDLRDTLEDRDVEVTMAAADGEQARNDLVEKEAAQADAIWVAGRPETGGQLASALATAGQQVPVVGGTGLRTEQVIETAGQGAELLVSVDAAQADADIDLAAALADAGSSPPGVYGAGAYDAALAVGDALSRCLPPASTAEDARQGCVAEMGQVNLTGAGGPVAFDDFGRRVHGELTVSTVADGTWTTRQGTENS